MKGVILVGIVFMKMWERVLVLIIIIVVMIIMIIVGINYLVFYYNLGILYILFCFIYYVY